MRSPPSSSAPSAPHHPLDGLVVGLVEGVAGRARHHRREPAGEGHLRVPADEGDRVEVAFAAFAEVHEGEPAPVVDHRVEGEGAPDALEDLELLAVQGVAVQHAVLRARVGHEAMVVEGRDRLGVGDAGGDDLAAPGVAGHEVRLHESGRDPDVRLDKPPVESDRGSLAGAPEIDVVGVVACEVVDHPDVLEHPRIPHHLRELVAEVGPVQAGGDEHGDGVAGDPGAFQPFDERPQEQPVRHRAGDVADEEAGRAGPGCRFGEAAAVKGGGDRGGRILDDRHGRLLDHRRLAPLGQPHLELAAPVEKPDVHLPSPLMPRSRGAAPGPGPRPVSCCARTPLRVPIGARMPCPRPATAAAGETGPRNLRRRSPR